MHRLFTIQNLATVTVAALTVSALSRPVEQRPGSVSRAVASLVHGDSVRLEVAHGTDARSVREETREALSAFGSRVRRLSSPEALESAFRSYFAYRAEHPQRVTKPYLYFVDFGLPNTAKRGYVFDMDALRIVDGPFTVAHGHGSGTDARGLPVRFSNAPGSAATSLGLYLAQETYTFRGTSNGRRYASVGMRMRGVSGDYNDNARARGIVAHGAPYVTASRAGRSEGCPAMEQLRARRLLPLIANGGMVFHFAPDPAWLAEDPWLARTEPVQLSVAD
jgi:hypothetical protein